MLLNFFAKPQKTFIALDIGSQNTKMLVFQKGKAIVEKMIIEATPPGSFQGGNILDKEVLFDFLAQCAVKMKIEDLKVIAGVSGKAVIAKKLDIPQVEESMLPEFVEIEAEQELFYNREEMELDYDILRGIRADKPENQSLLVVTVLKKVIEDYNQLIKKSGMECEILDTSATALFNSFEYNEDLDENKNYMVLDIGRSGTNMALVLKKQIVFLRHLSVGGDFFNQGIQKKMNIDYQEAEELKISASKEQSAPKELVSLIRTELNESFVEEILSCYELFSNLFPEQNVHCAYITGGACQTLGLSAHLKEKLSCPVYFFNPFKKIELKPELKKEQGRLQFFSAVATGLALRSFL